MGPVVFFVLLATLASFSPAAHSQVDDEAFGDYICDACKAFNEEMYRKTQEFVDYHKVRITAGTSQTLKIDTARMVSTMCDKEWAGKHGSPMMMEACRELVKSDQRSFEEVWSGKDPDLYDVYNVWNSLCVEKLHACPAPEPLGDKAENKRSTCEACVDVVGDIAMELRWRGASGAGASEKKKALWDIVETVCSAAPMRHPPRPRHKRDNGDLVAKCDRLLDGKDEAIIEALVSMGEHASPRAICRSVVPKCQGKEDL